VEKVYYARCVCRAIYSSLEKLTDSAAFINEARRSAGELRNRYKGKDDWAPFGCAPG